MRQGGSEETHPQVKGHCSRENRYNGRRTVEQPKRQVQDGRARSTCTERVTPAVIRGALLGERKLASTSPWTTPNKRPYLCMVSVVITPSSARVL